VLGGGRLDMNTGCFGVHSQAGCGAGGKSGGNSVSDKGRLWSYVRTIREEYKSSSLTGRSCVGLCMEIESSLTRGGTRFNSAIG
jgi:hypothetical protein